MNTVSPIRKKEDVRRVIKWFADKGPRYEILILIGLYTGLRYSDVSKLIAKQVRDGVFSIREQKTGKENTVALSHQTLTKIKPLITKLNIKDEELLFNSGKTSQSKVGINQLKPWTRQHVYNLLNACVRELNIPIKCGNHTLRKTFGYHAFRDGNMNMEMLRKLFNHSNTNVTRRYIGLEDDEIIEARKTISY